MDLKEIWELLSAVVTTLGLPFAIFVYVADRRKAREVEEADRLGGIVAHHQGGLRQGELRAETHRHDQRVDLHQEGAGLRLGPCQALADLGRHAFDDVIGDVVLQRGIAKRGDARVDAGRQRLLRRFQNLDSGSTTLGNAAAALLAVWVCV